MFLSSGLVDDRSYKQNVMILCPSAVPEIFRRSPWILAKYIISPITDILGDGST